MDKSPDTRFKPPYLPFKTFWSFIEELRSKPLPPHLDRSLLRSKSGTDQANLLAALKSFGLIEDESQAVQPGLRELVTADEEGARRTLESLLRSGYLRQFSLSEQNATEKSLNDSFEEDFGVNGETRRKAVTFFLQASRFAGIALSPHFPTTRLGSGRTAGTRGKLTVTTRQPRATDPNPGTGSGTSSTAQQLVVQVGRGKITLIVDVPWLELPIDKLTALRAAIQAVEDLSDRPEPGGQDDVESLDA